MTGKLWVLYVMDEETADPVPASVEPFTRLGRSILEAKAAWLGRFGMPWRIDPTREEVVHSWTDPSVKRQ